MPAPVTVTGDSPTTAVLKDAAAATKRPRGKAIEQRLRLLIVLTVRCRDMDRHDVARLYGVSKSSVTRLCQRADKVLERTRGWKSAEDRRAALLAALKDRKRGGRGGRPAKLDKRRHGAFVRDLFRRDDDALYVHEVRRRLAARYPDELGGRKMPSLSTVRRFVVKTLGLTRKKRTFSMLNANGVTGVNLKKRIAFVEHWFGRSAKLAFVGTRREFDDQRQNWHLRDGIDPRCIFFIDETGVNWNTLRRKYGRSPAGQPCIAVVKSKDAVESRPRGPNHSVLLAMGVAGVIAAKVLVGKGTGTKRTNFCDFLRRDVVPAMRKAATEAGLAKDEPLYLVMDNASIHHGDPVKRAMRRRVRTDHAVQAEYLPPYAPTLNPIELVNADVKRHLQARRNELPVGADLSEAILQSVEAVGKGAEGARRAAAFYASEGWRRG